MKKGREWMQIPFDDPVRLGFKTQGLIETVIQQ